MIDLNNVRYSTNSLTQQQKETNRVSYWLEKLFHQEKVKESADNVVVFQATNEGKHDSNVDRVNKLENDRKTIRDMVHNSNTILMSISSVFPFDLYPTTINVEATRVTIITRQLFASQVHSVDIKDISSVFIETGILFAALTLISKIYSQKELVVSRLWKNEAILLRRIIEGLRMFEKKEINTTNFSRGELLVKLGELSATEIVL